MAALLLAFGLVSGLVTLAWRQAEEPTIKLHFQKQRLRMLASLPDSKLTLSEADDLLVLARRFGQFELVKRAEKLVALRRKQRKS